MKKYHDLAERARSAARLRRRNDAALMKQISGDLPTQAELEAGKTAENSDAEDGAYSHENKVLSETGSDGCLVNPHNTPSAPTPDTHTSRLRDLLNTPDVQSRIKAGETQRKRDETRKATMQRRVAVPTTAWKTASQDEKFRFAGHATERADGLAFSLNLSEKTQNKLRRHRDPLRAFTDTLNRELKMQGLSGMPYALALEESSKDKLHVHGFLIPPAERDGVRRALRAAGGAIIGKASGRQLTLKTLSGGGGWAFYCQKDQSRTDEALAGDVRLFLNRAMTQAAREFSRSIR
ncbi:hypothetical protein PhaeoP83_01284 [Phaeobacter inhibens]|uniref:Uncharacterized protein n=1 Tax=Phaeobacter inhibens TaxID=221822 RepID=A0ABM6RCK9_9RHOB|nr:hypothetical protein [Phaeobacter inhibens]AUQ49574.1 hypothetical protein PhaeoP83_01284 [Phaeobacter inhibens]AUQ94129.1 hypothetical protein PhaeoP66_01331 [Phaeobacter inhibens]AUR19377.1 hypothetical protein PhaeoP80_01284 [Phaeobacter inhibens]